MPKPERFKKDSNFLNADSSNQEKALASKGKSSLPFLLVLVCFSFFIYKSSLSNEFSYDDLSVVVENYYIKSSSITAIKTWGHYICQYSSRAYSLV